MTKIRKIACLLGFCLIGGCNTVNEKDTEQKKNLSFEPTQPENTVKPYRIISVNGMYLASQRDDSIIVDARNTNNYKQGHIKNALCLPFDSTEETITDALPDFNKSIIVYCTNPNCPASKKLAIRLIELGYKNVFECPDGIEGWTKAGKPIYNGLDHARLA